MYYDVTRGQRAQAQFSRAVVRLTSSSLVFKCLLFSIILFAVAVVSPLRLQSDLSLLAFIIKFKQFLFFGLYLFFFEFLYFPFGIIFVLKYFADMQTQMSLVADESFPIIITDQPDSLLIVRSPLHYSKSVVTNVLYFLLSVYFYLDLQGGMFFSQHQKC